MAFLWELANAVAVILAVNMLPLDSKRKTAMLLLCAIEFANSVFYMQFNQPVAAAVISVFMLVEEGKDNGTLLIVAGTMFKLYPVVGLTFLFSKHKSKGFIICDWLVAYIICIADAYFQPRVCHPVLSPMVCGFKL